MLLGLCDFSGDVRNQREVINTAIKADVASIFKGKTHSQLVAMQKQITNKINAGGTIDIGVIAEFAFSLLCTCRKLSYC